MLDFSITLVIALLNITALFFVLNKVLSGPTTDSSAFCGEDAKVQDTRVFTVDMNDAPDDETIDIFRRAQMSAQQNCDKIIEDARLQANSMFNYARRCSDGQKISAYSGYKEEVDALVAQSTGKILPKEVRTEDTAGIILQEIAKK
ncbi:hypothetical protein FACS1894102_2690 [Spirochaetia bacterium]|nr:hypothetical protein FACS1894102_2690 [Spirochaetia bacterium]